MFRRRAPAVRRDLAMEGVLGTALDARVTAATDAAARRAEAALLDEIDRLEAVFSRFRPDSALNVWLAATEDSAEAPVAADLAEGLRLARLWTERTGGAFHPGADTLGALWRAAEATGRPPAPADLARVAESLRAQPVAFSPDGRRARRPVGVTLNLNAIAKGHIVDRAAAAALAVPDVSAVLLNVGGDLCHVGAGEAVVAIADPRTDADNAPPLARLRVGRAAVATSGAAHRGHRVGGARRSHVLDPRTGEPAEGWAGVSVLAPDCATADALATALAVLSEREGLALVGATPGVGCLLVDAAGRAVAGGTWRRHARR